MVCLGNICRSPTAEAVLRKLVQAQGLQQQIVIDSAGTSDWHRGEAPDPRAIRAAADRGYDLSTLRARQVMADDFIRFDYILAMDEQNLRDLERLCPPEPHATVDLLLSYGTSNLREVPDPYDRTLAVFEEVLDLCENACADLLQQLIQNHRLHLRRERT